MLHAWLAATAPPAAAFRAVAADDKTCRGARTSDGTRVHLFSIVDHATGAPLGQVNAGGKDHEERPRFARVLDRIDLTDVVVTADALDTQKAHARYCTATGHGTSSSSSGTSRGLHDQIAGLPWCQIPVATTKSARATADASPAPSS